MSNAETVLLLQTGTPANPSTIPWATFLRDLLLVILGGVLSLGGNYLINKYQTRSRRKTLRKSIFSELNSTTELDDWINKSDRGTYPGGEVISTTVFDTNAGEIGLLDNPEKNAIIDYYSSAKVLNNRIISIREMNMHTGGESKFGDLRNRMLQVRHKRNEALRLLSEKTEQEIVVEYDGSEDDGSGQGSE